MFMRRMPIQAKAGWVLCPSDRNWLRSDVAVDSPRQPTETLFDWKNAPGWEDYFDDEIREARVNQQAVSRRAWLRREVAR